MTNESTEIDAVAKGVNLSHTKYFPNFIADVLDL